MNSYSGGGKGLVIAIVVVVVLLLAGGGLFMMKSNSSGINSNSGNVPASKPKVKHVLIKKDAAGSFQIAEVVITTDSGKILGVNDLTHSEINPTHDKTGAVLYDGNPRYDWGGGSVYHNNDAAGNWVKLSLNVPDTIKEIKIYNRTDCCWDRLNGVIMTLLGENEQPIAPPITLTAEKVQTYQIVYN